MSGETSVHFSVEVPKDVGKNVMISFSGGQAPMTQAPVPKKNTNKQFFLFSLSIQNQNVYPASLHYSYSFDNNKPRLVIIQRPPEGDIFINDSVVPKTNEAHFFYTVEFYLKVDIDKSSHIYVAAPKPVFWNGTKFVSRCLMTASSIPKTYTCRSCISCVAFGAIPYIYQVTYQGKSFYSNCNSLYIRSPIGGKHICIYDQFDAPELSPLFPTLIYPQNVSPISSILQVEYQNEEEKPSGVFLSIKDEKPESFTKEINWNYTKEIPKIHSPTKINIGIVPEGKNQLQWDENGIFTLVSSSSPVDWLTIHKANITTNRRTTGVFVQLISVPPNKESFCGDFSSLCMLIDWAKKCGIGHIHVGLERINDNRLIDPVLCNIDCKGCEGKSLEEVRLIKLQHMKNQFTEWMKRKGNDSFYKEFVRINATVLSPLCKTPFSMYTQYRVYADLNEASVYAARNGVSLIVDIIEDGVEGSVKQQVQLLSPFFHYLNVVNAASTIGFVSVNDLAKLFGPLYSYALKVSNVYGSTALLRPEFIPEETNIAVVDASGVPEDKEREFCNKLTTYRKMLADREKRKKQKDYIKLFSSISNSLPPRVIFDAAVTSILNINELKEANIIPCTKMDFCAPLYLSPEVSTEYTSNISDEEVKEAVQSKLSGRSFGITLFLSDLLTTCDCEKPSCKQIQNILYHNRFVFTRSASDLLSNEEEIYKIRNLLLIYSRANQ